MDYISRRSPIYSTRGMTASSQPLASIVGLNILQDEGNAADAAVAMAAVLNVTEPTSTGIGGDCFCLFFDAKTKQVSGINGSGRAPKGLSIELLKDQGIERELPPLHAHTVTVPGAAAGWIDTLEKFGQMEIKDVLMPAIELAEKGFSVCPITAYFWERGIKQLKTGPYADEMLLNGQAPKPGQLMRNPTLGQTFRELIEQGKDGFYQGRIAEEIVNMVQSKDGVLTLDDLKNHHSTFDTPISTNYRGMDVFEIPPNGQGITALLALNILEEFQLEEEVHNSTNHLHLLIETMRIAFADTRWYVTDPSIEKIPIDELLSKFYAKSRRELISREFMNRNIERGVPFSSSDTVYFCVVDSEGNACSFINSNYMGFGTGLIPKGCGFTLQNRGANFSLDNYHPNRLMPNKRPYHTIIPGMMLKDKELYAPFGVMGGFMQPQGHVQVVSNIVDFKMDPQTALDRPRFCIADGTSTGKIALEEGINVSVMADLAKKGHLIVPTTGYGRAVFGRGQIIVRNPGTGILCGGSDPRADGMAIGW